MQANQADQFTEEPWLPGQEGWHCYLWEDWPRSDQFPYQFPDSLGSSFLHFTAIPYSRSYLFHFPVEETEAPIRWSQSSPSSLAWFTMKKKSQCLLRREIHWFFFFLQQNQRDWVPRADTRGKLRFNPNCGAGKDKAPQQSLSIAGSFPPRAACTGKLQWKYAPTSSSPGKLLPKSFLGL